MSLPQCIADTQRPKHAESDCGGYDGFAQARPAPFARRMSADVFFGGRNGKVSCGFRHDDERVLSNQDFGVRGVCNYPSRPDHRYTHNACMHVLHLAQAIASMASRKVKQRQHC